MKMQFYEDDFKIFFLSDSSTAVNFEISGYDTSGLSAKYTPTLYEQMELTKEDGHKSR